jgi:hypothetical protein
MEPLAFVEVVDRHKDVLSRHAVYRWPARIGRGYRSDILLDDAFVAADHLEIAPAANGRFTVSDLGSMNGFFVGDSRQRLESAEVGPDDLVRIGHTQIRVRVPSYEVPRERLLRATALYRRPAAFMLAAALMVALFVWNAWIMTSDENDRTAMLFPTIGLLTLIVVWISIWSFVSNALGRRPNFAAHGFVACAGIVALVAADSFFDYVGFGFDIDWILYLDGIVATALLGYIVYRHLLLNSRASRRTLAVAGFGISASLAGALLALDFALDRTQDGTQDYSAAIKAPAFLFASGASPAEFLSQADALKHTVDEMARIDSTRAHASRDR